MSNPTDTTKQETEEKKPDVIMNIWEGIQYKEFKENLQRAIHVMGRGVPKDPEMAMRQEQTKKAFGPVYNEIRDELIAIKAGFERGRTPNHDGSTFTSDIGTVEVRHEPNMTYYDFTPSGNTVLTEGQSVKLSRIKSIQMDRHSYTRYRDRFEVRVELNDSNQLTIGSDDIMFPTTWNRNVDYKK